MFNARKKMTGDEYEDELEQALAALRKRSSEQRTVNSEQQGMRSATQVAASDEQYHQYFPALPKRSSKRAVSSEHQSVRNERRGMSRETPAIHMASARATGAVQDDGTAEVPTAVILAARRIRRMADERTKREVERTMLYERLAAIKIEREEERRQLKEVERKNELERRRQQKERLREISSKAAAKETEEAQRDAAVKAREQARKRAEAERNAAEREVQYGRTEEAEAARQAAEARLAWRAAERAKQERAQATAKQAEAEARKAALAERTEAIVKRRQAMEREAARREAARQALLLSDAGKAGKAASRHEFATIPLVRGPGSVKQRSEVKEIELEAFLQNERRKKYERDSERRARELRRRCEASSTTTYASSTTTSRGIPAAAAVPSGTSSHSQGTDCITHSEHAWADDVSLTRLMRVALLPVGQTQCWPHEVPSAPVNLPATQTDGAMESIKQTLARAQAARLAARQNSSSAEFEVIAQRLRARQSQ